MKNIFTICCAAVLAVGASGLPAAELPGAAEGLRCEGLTQPLAVDAAAPRLSWTMHPGGGQTQTAYRVIVASSAERLVAGTGDLWDSGKVSSEDGIQIVYGGKPLATGERAFWRVMLWGKGGEALPAGDVGSFTMGVMSPSDWRAKWIAFPNDDGNTVSRPAPLLRKEFTLQKAVARATIHVCGLGQYELTLNGKKVGDAVLTPAWTEYAKTCSYDTYDVTGQLKAGGNALGIMLGNGMYNVLKIDRRYSKFVGSKGVPKAIAQLDIEHPDGSHTILGTDDTWKAARGPVVFSHEYGGEDYDARAELSGWDAPGFDAERWAAAAIVEGPGGGKEQLIAAINPPIKLQKVYADPKITAPRPGVAVYDFGQNLSGWPRLTVRGTAGAAVRLTPGELLNNAGMVTQASSGSPVWFSYTLKGGGEETWMPRFSYYGYRYIQVETTPPQNEPAAPAPQIVGLSSVWVHADLRKVGSFESSDETLNKIHTLINAAILSNSQSVLTDCPHREKLGWLEQTHLMGDAMAMNYDIAGYYAKICRDMRDAQTASGLVPDIAPEFTQFSAGFRDSPEWGSAAVIDPWLMYRYYGDRKTFETQYDCMTRYVAYLGTKAKQSIVSHGLGDWYDIGPGPVGKAQLTSTGLTATAVYYQDVEILRQTAELLGKPGDAQKYAALAAEIRVAFNKNFYNAATGAYEKGSQTATAMPVALGLADPELQPTLVIQLAESVRGNKNRVTAGDVGFSYVVKALTEHERGDVLFDMMTQSDGPGYVDQLKKGATTLTEAWDALPKSSQNHLMLGHAEAWLYRGLAGIQNAPDSVAFKKIIIRPQVVEKLGQDGRGFVKASCASSRGLIASAWERNGTRLKMTVTIPPTSTARIYVPAGDAKAVRALAEEGDLPVLQAVGGPGVAVFEAAPGKFTFESDLP